MKVMTRWGTASSASTTQHTFDCLGEKKEEESSL